VLTAGPSHICTTKGAKALLAAILAAAFVTRALFGLLLGTTTFWPDEERYAAEAQRVVEGREPGQDCPPLYVLCLAGVRLVSGDHFVLAARLIQAVVGALACLLIYLVAKQLTTARVGLAAAAMAAVYPYFIYLSGVLLAESLYVPLLLAGVLFLAYFATTGKLKWLPAAGAAFGVSYFCKPFSIAFLPFLSLWVLALPARTVARMGRAAAFAGTFVVMLGVFALWNWAVHGEPFLVSSQGGWALYHGFGPNATASRTSSFELPDGLQAEIQGKDEAEQTRIMKAEAVEIIRSQPLRTVGLYTSKWLNFWRPFPNTYSRNRWTGVLFQWVGALSYTPVLVLGLAGLWLMRRRGASLSLLVAMLVAIPTVSSFFITTVRRRLPVEPYLMIAAAVTVVHVLDLIIARRRDRLCTAGAGDEERG